MSKTWRVGVIGSTGRGNYGHGLDVAWQAIDRTQVVAVADDNKSGAAAAARKLKLNHSFTDWRQMLDEARPEIVAICPRWVDRHAEMAIEAASRGIHVYMEKPFCRTLEEADAIAAACRAGKAKLAVAHPTRYSPRLATVRKLIADGAIGDVLEWRARGKEDRRGGSEDLWVLGTHMLDVIHVLAGLPETCLAQVTQAGRAVTRKDVVEGNEGLGPLAGDAVQAVYQLKDGSQAMFSSVRNQRGNPSRYGLRIFGSTGVLELREGAMAPVRILQDASWSPGLSGKAWQAVSTAGIGQPEPLTGSEHSARHHAAILDLLAAIEDDRRPLGDELAARDVAEMIMAVFESARTGGVVSLPLENRQHPLRQLPTSAG